MARDDEPIRPMTLGNMRENCVRGLFVTCSACGYHTEVNVDGWPDDVPVPSFGAHAVYQVRPSRGETELDRAAGLLAARGEAVMTEEAKAAFAKRYEEGETGEMMGRPEGGPPASIFRSEPPFFGWIA